MKLITKYLLSLLGILLLCSPMEAQDRIQITSGCSYDHRPLEKEYYGYYPSERAVQVMEEILKAASLNPNAFDLKVSNVSNAVATVENGKRYILYSQEFMGQVESSAQNKWSVFSIMAHEIGHHILGHNFDETNPDVRKRMELEADEFSGSVLRALCATQDDALAAITLLPAGVSSPNYPPVSARREMIANSWYNKDFDLRQQGRDPCGQVIELEFGKQFKKDNLARNVQAQVKEEQMIINFDAVGIPGFRFYRSFIATPQFSDLTPKTLEWLTEPEKAGKGRQLIWHFAKDGYTRKQVLKPQELGIAVFKTSKVPKPISATSYAPCIGAFAIGGVGLALASNLNKDSDDLYFNIYAEVRNPADPIYQNGNPSRSEVYQTANDKYKQAQLYRNIGIACLAGGVTLFIERLLKNKKSKIGNLYIGENGIGIRRPLGERSFYD